MTTDDIKTVFNNINMLSMEEAQRNQASFEAKKAARKAAKAAARTATATAIGNAQTSAESEVRANVTPVVSVPFGTFSVAPVPKAVVRMPTPEEVAAIEVAATRDAADRAAYRRGEAKVARSRLDEQRRESRPTKEQFVQWVVGAGFVYNRDAGTSAIYSCEGEEVVVFDGALKKG